MDVNRLDGVAVQPPPPPVARPANGAVQVQAEVPQAQAYDSRAEYVENIDTLRRAVAAVNTSIASHMRHLSINFHEPTGRHIVTVYDSETNQAIREIPPQRVLDAHASILEIAGLFVDRRG